MRRRLIAGNWKMHLKAAEASLLVHRLQERIENHRNTEVVLAPSFLTLQPLSTQIDRRKFRLAAQNCHWEDQGAFTGEVSATMLHDLVHYVIIGHSERRYIFNETDDDIARKVAAVIRNNMTPILCVGETKADRHESATKQVLHDQLMVNLKNITSSEARGLVVAYEPVWAIGTGIHPTHEQVAEAVHTIRHNVAEMFGQKVESELRVLYGGSVDPEVAGGYLNINGIDGLLIGGASLNCESFSQIVQESQERE
jgi:triosephosphate isomerase